MMLHLNGGKKASEQRRGVMHRRGLPRLSVEGQGVQG